MTKIITGPPVSDNEKAHRNNWHDKKKKETMHDDTVRALKGERS